MSVRTTGDAVIAVLGRDYDSDNAPAVDPYIESASSLVDEVVTRAADDGYAIATAKAELMERWLAAHDYCLSDRLYRSRNELGASGAFQGETGMGLDYTPYGQRAKAFDSSGWLVAIANGLVVGLAWAGKTAATQLTYSQRNGTPP